MKVIEWCVYIHVDEFLKGWDVFLFFFFKQKTAYEMLRSLVGSEDVYKRQEQYRQYMALSPGAIEAAGGRFLVRGGPHEVFEGDLSLIHI